MRHKHVKRKIGLKYCGGCNPHYDRVALVEWINKELENDVDLLKPDKEGIDCLLIIAGCDTACVDLTSFKNVPVRLITCPDDAREMINELKKK